MKRFPLHPLFPIALCCALFLLATGCGQTSRPCADAQDCPASDLLSVVAISRHGIRSPIPSQATMNSYTQQPQGFPLWPAPADIPGQLSTKGLQNATLLGAWYRDFYAAQGLLPAAGACPAAGSVFVWADGGFQRTLQTAQGYIDGMFGSENPAGCGIQVQQSATLPDPYIDTAAAGVCAIDTAKDLTAFNDRVVTPRLLIERYAAQLQELQTVTHCCQLSACVTPANPNPTSCSLLDLPTTVNTTGEVGFANGTVFGVADNVSEMFELEYGQGMPDANCANTSGAQCVGWGAIPADGIFDMSKLHVENMVNLTCQLPSFAQVGSTNLMSQVVGTMDQNLTGVPDDSVLAPAESTFTLFVAHDENISAIAGFLGGLSWKADGFQQNDPGPAGALVFELHRIKQSGKLVVRAFYVVATLDQMRAGTVLTLQTPPDRIPLRIPKCDYLFDCPYDRFKSFVTSHVRQDCLVSAPSMAARRR